jgi:hypothetical protein
MFPSKMLKCYGESFKSEVKKEKLSKQQAVDV